MYCKMIYFYRMYKGANDEQKNRLIEWFNKYNIKLEKYLGNEDYYIKKDIIFNYDY